jgi:hypothetical protein
MEQQAEVEQDLSFCAPLASLLKHPDWSRLDQKTRLSVEFQAEHPGKFRADKNLPSLRILVYQQP